MSEKREAIFQKMLRDLDAVDFIKSTDFPNIDLYMDQLTRFMEQHMEGSKRNEEDKILTKTMINNYAKNDILPAPEKKQYTKEHLMTLVFIYYLKNILSITDIQKVLDPINEKFFNSKEYGLIDIYEEIFSYEPHGKEHIKKDLERIYAKSNIAFENANEEDKELLKNFFLICELSYDIYLRKHLLEKIIDAMPKEKEKSKGKEKESKEKESKEQKEPKESKKSKESKEVKESKKNTSKE